MRLFLDTNVLIEYFERRTHYLPVSRIFDAIEDGEVEAIMSVGGLYTITYLLTTGLKRQGIHRPEQTEKLRSILNDVVDLVSTAELSSESISQAINDARFSDIEDSYQYHCAMEHQCDVFVTINIKDYPASADIPVLLPQEYVERCLS